MSAKYDLKINRMNEIVAFLQSNLDEGIYMSQPPLYKDLQMNVD